MGCENIRPKRSSNSISILVVDDDTTCLSFVAALLKKFKYEVVTAKHPSDALCALRIKGGAFDLVVSDVNMPDMNGFELQEAITHEFNLPVVLMSVDSNSKGLKSGAALFISKPVSPNDLKDLWQFSTNNMRKKRQVVNEEENDYYSQNNKEIINPKRNGKKPKVKWTNGLQNRFLEAIRSIGLERSVPKKILEVMNVPGLTRENVASHLQKYRMFLKRVSDASYKVEDDGGGDEGGLITRNYSLQTLKPHFPHQMNSPYTIHSTNHHSFQIGSSGMNFPSNHQLVENKVNHDHEECLLMEECLNVGNGGRVGVSPLPLLPSSCVYDGELLLPPSSFDDDDVIVNTSTQQSSFSPTTHLLQNNHQLITIQNQPLQMQQHEFGEYTTESSLLFPGGMNDSSSHHQAVNQVQGSMEPVQPGAAPAVSSGFNKPLESGDGDALESLLAFGLFGEDQIQSLQGI